MTKFSLLILCAGFGNRMLELTKDVPKPLLRFKNKILLGNTINYLSEICKTNSITAVEISPVAMAELLVLVKKKDNIIPCLCDAHFPEKYRIQANNPEIIYQDIAQNDQVDIFIRNCEYFKPKQAFLMLKTKSIGKGDFDIFKNTEKRLSEIFEKVESVNINKWAKGHSAYFME